MSADMKAQAEVPAALDTANVWALLVTYADRATLVESVVAELLEQGIGRVLIIDNASVASSAARLAALVQASNDKVRVLSLKQNLGSAGGFKAGLEVVLAENVCTHVWLLDDDNQPASGALRVLLSRAEQLEARAVTPYGLASFRPDRVYHRRLAAGEAPEAIFHKKSSFVGIHVWDILQRRWRSLLGAPKRALTRALHVEQQLPMAPYGGLFTSVASVRRIGLPNADFFVYIDDIDFTHRIQQRGGQIHFVKEAMIEDIDPSWRHADPQATVFRTVLMSDAGTRVYYQIRNSAYWFGRYWSPSKLLFALNEAIFVAALFLLAARTGRWKRFGLVTRAIRDGNAGRLGIRDAAFFANYQ